jgi:GNAT superfamily N-acetyltransferase
LTEPNHAAGAAGESPSKPRHAPQEQTTMKLELLYDTPIHHARVQRVLEGAPQVSMLTEGHEPRANDGQALFDSVAPGGTKGMKRVFMIRNQDEDIGVIDLYLGWNESYKVCIGLFLLTEPHQRKGLGSRAFTMIRDEIARWPSFSLLRIGVVQTNKGALEFWKSVGFVENGEEKTGEEFVAPITILERPI